MGSEGGKESVEGFKSSIPDIIYSQAWKVSDSMAPVKTTVVIACMTGNVTTTLPTALAYSSVQH